MPVLVSLTKTFQLSAVGNDLAGDVLELYSRLGWLTVIVWCFYPIVWLFSEGFQSFSVSFESVAFSILDIVSKAVFAFIIVGSSGTLDHTKAVRADV